MIPVIRTFASITNGDHVAEFVKECNEEMLDPITEAERVIRRIAREEIWDVDEEELDEIVDDVLRDMRDEMWRLNIQWD